MRRTGVYVHWGPSETGGLPRVYVGEGDGVLSRLDMHAKSKDFWTHALVFTSKDQNLNKAHVQHLEARLVGLAYEAKRCELDNGNVPQLPALSEADAADAEGFLVNLLLCLPVVGVNMFEAAKASQQLGRRLLLKAKGIEAQGIESPEGFVVQSGSQAVKAETASIHAYLSDLRRALIDKGVFLDHGDFFKLSQDYTFNSPSTASGVLLGRTSNGRAEWKDSTGRTLREIQELEASDE
jgi:hypothetical protein